MPVTVITTRAHWDHIGGHQYFPNFAVHEDEITWISKQFPIPLQVVKKNKVTLKNLKTKKKYFIKVRAYKKVKGDIYYGKWSKVVKKKTK